MRHIPEEELHAYLDQALSRSQCVEIESHLASCLACRRERDAIAALRDRTTALLSRLAPGRRIPPPAHEIRQRAAGRVRERRRAVRASVWAASILLALGFGWTAKSLVEMGTAPPPVAVTAPGEQPSASTADLIPTERHEPAPTDSSTAQPDLPRVRVADAPRARSTSRLAANSEGTKSPQAAISEPPFAPVEGLPTEPLRIEVTPRLSLPADELLPDGLWRSLSWAGAQAESDGWVPRVEGLPVVEVQLQDDDGESGGPLMVVAQRLQSGQMIRTVQGPIAKVSDLLSRQPGQTVTASVEVSDTTGTRTDKRMLAIYGSISVDSLRAFLLKVR